MKTFEELAKEIEEECGGCPRWSGTDCMNNPYVDGCEKDDCKFAT